MTGGNQQSKETLGVCVRTCPMCYANGAMIAKWLRWRKKLRYECFSCGYRWYHRFGKD